jgi:hypothetical protein
MILSGDAGVTFPAGGVGNPASAVVGLTDTQTLTNKSVVATQLTGTVAAARLPAGAVLQVVNATYSTEVSTTGGTYIDTGLTATITPSSASNKILVIVDQVGLAKAAGNGGLYLQLLRGSSSISVLCTNDVYTGTALALRVAGVGTNYLDSPSTTSATTYKTQFYAFNSITAYVQQAGSTSTITLMEIAA